MAQAASPSTPAAARVVDDRSSLGILFLCAGLFVFSVQDAIIKELSGAYSVFQISLIRSAIGAPLVLLLWRAVSKDERLASERFWGHVARTLLMFTAYTSFYMSVAALPLSVAVSIGFSAPLFILLFSIVLFGDRVGVWRWMAVLIGFGGVLVMVRPGGGAFEPAALLALVCAVCYAAGSVMARQLGATESGAKMAVYATIGYFFFSLIGVWVGPNVAGPMLAHPDHPSVAFATTPWRWLDLNDPSDLWDFALMAAVGLLSVLGFYGLAEAYRLGRSATIAPFEYTGILWATLWGVLFFSEIPDAPTLIGMAMIVGAGLFILHRERVRSAPMLGRRGRLRMRSGL